MSLPLLIAVKARREIARAEAWFEQQEDGLGYEFEGELLEYFRRIREMPELYAVVRKIIRRAIVERYSYLIYYRVSKKHIKILAVLHGRRDSESMATRLGLD